MKNPALPDFSLVFCCTLFYALRLFLTVFMRRDCGQTDLAELYLRCVTANVIRRKFFSVVMQCEGNKSNYLRFYSIERVIYHIC